VLACAFDPPVEVDGADGVPVGVDVALDGEVVVDVLLVCNVDEPPVDFLPGDVGLSGVDDHLVVYALVVLPFICDPDAETDVAVGVGAVLAEVFDELWVLAVPPLSVGWTLIAG
jgi:hypothetical protein